MIEKLNKFMNLRDFAKMLGKTYQSAYSMATTGRYGVSGHRVYLKTYLNESGMQTTMEDYERFLTDLNDPSYGGGAQ